MMKEKKGRWTVEKNCNQEKKSDVAESTNPLKSRRNLKQRKEAAKSL